MNISTCQVYPEVDVSYKIPSFVMKELRKGLNSLDKEITYFKEKFKGQDFELGIVISATREKYKPLVMGPTFFNRYKRVDFVLHIPYKKFDSSYDEFSYIVEKRFVDSVDIGQWPPDSNQPYTRFDYFSCRDDPDDNDRCYGYLASRNHCSK